MSTHTHSSISCIDTVHCGGRGACPLLKQMQDIHPSISLSISTEQNKDFLSPPKCVRVAVPILTSLIWPPIVFVDVLACFCFSPTRLSLSRREYAVLIHSASNKSSIIDGIKMDWICEDMKLKTNSSNFTDIKIIRTLAPTFCLHFISRKVIFLSGLVNLKSTSCNTEW